MAARQRPWTANGAVGLAGPQSQLLAEFVCPLHSTTAPFRLVIDKMTPASSQRRAAAPSGRQWSASSFAARAGARRQPRRSSALLPSVSCSERAAALVAASPQRGSQLSFWRTKSLVATPAEAPAAEAAAPCRWPSAAWPPSSVVSWQLSVSTSAPVPLRPLATAAPAWALWRQFLHSPAANQVAVQNGCRSAEGTPRGGSRRPLPLFGLCLAQHHDIPQYLHRSSQCCPARQAMPQPPPQWESPRVAGQNSATCHRCR